MSGLEEDIAYLRELTRDDPLAARRTGAIMIAVGLIFGVSAFRVWAWQHGFLPPIFRGFPPLDAILLFLTAVTLIQRRMPEQPANAGTRALSTALNSVGLAVVVATAALGAATRTTGNPDLFAIFPTVLFAFYGSAWWVVFAVTRERWAILVLAGCISFAMIAASLAGRPESWLALALGLLLLVALPGWRLLGAKR